MDTRKLLPTLTKMFGDIARTAGCLMAAGGAAITCCLLFVGCLSVFGQFPDLCGNQILRTALSPDGRLKAVVFERDCGATTGFSTQVSVLAAGQKLPNEAGNLFVADNGGGLAPTVAVTWTGRRQMLVRYDSFARVYLSNKRVTVRSGLFRTESVAARYSVRLALSSIAAPASHRKP